jgi:hypothetical protein
MQLQLHMWTSFGVSYPMLKKRKRKVSMWAYILGKTGLGSSMYVRPRIPFMYRKVIETLAAAVKKGILIAGTPGIGESSCRLGCAVAESCAQKLF